MMNLMKWKMWPKWGKISAFIFLFLLITEIILRFIIGLGNMALYEEHKDYEYFYAPNQDVYRYGNHIRTNEFGMRSKPINKKRKKTVLEFGDSVLNGGAHVDQDKLATTIEENKLNEKSDDNVQVLNVSAQSWGLSNAFAYLKTHGDFNADLIILVFSSHDLNDNMHFRKVVGVHPAWPNQKPLLALTDAWSGAIWPYIKKLITGNGEYSYLNGFDDSKINPGWQDFFNYSLKKNIPLIVFLHASQKELDQGDFNKKGKKIQEICNQNNIRIITDLDKLGKNRQAFIDDIHMNEEGHQIMADLLLPEIKKIINE